ncbi:transposase [Sediminicoccus rosea]|uniref:Transposase n=1 Tax=Sediminicoccus rosea TaxID=1225128 RepID=A0ABZ0PL65_9PROT|nr:transposase [Sediminicoccus rosea]WPB86212.1 transposase [Sediminicoccus rosea]
MRDELDLLLPAIFREPRVYPRGPRPRRPSWILVPYDKLTDEQWTVLSIYLPMPQRGRPCDQRARMDAIFRVAATEGPWRDLPAHYGQGASVARHFRRLTHAGVWERLLVALAAARPGSVLRQLEGLICRAARRAIRIRGIALIALVRRLGLFRALPGPPLMMPDPDLSEIIRRMPIAAQFARWREDLAGVLRMIKALKALHSLAGGRRRIPREVREAWL